MKKPIFVDGEKADRIHRASLKVLANTGVSLDHEEAEELLLAAGARRDGNRVLIPPEMVEEALEKAKSEISIYNLHGQEAMRLKAGNTYFGPGSDALYNIDIEEWTIRNSTLADVGRNIRIADSLGFDFVMSMGLPHDVEKKKLYSSIFAEMVKNTVKPMVVTSTSLEDIKQIYRIAEIAAGGEKEFQEKPFILAYMEPISPLQMDKKGIDRMLYCVEKDIPVLYAAGANSGSGAPISAEGGVIQGSAESLVGLVLALLKNKNARFVYGANTSAMDMKSMIVAYGAPEWAKTVAMYADMGKYYNLPSWGTAGCSDTYYLDSQAAWEAQESILMALYSRTTMAHDVGFLGHGELYDPRMLVLTDAMIKRSKHLLKPLSLDKGNIDYILQVIDEVARGEEIYPSHAHTFKNFRQSLWLPPGFVFKKVLRDLEHEGPWDMAEELKKEVKRILREAGPQPLAEEKEAEISNYLNGL